VLVTGGTGTLGGLVARHLAVTGRARCLVLASRSGPAALGAADLAAKVADAGATVVITACDAADQAELAGLLAGLRPHPALTGVIHASGVLDDGVIESLTPARVDAVMRPKADAAWNLHELTREASLREFVLFSAGAATFGAPGQGNYAAANAFLDALAAGRQAAGLPAVSLAWGLWADASAMTGHLATGDRGRITRGGVTALSAEEGLALLDRALARDEPLLVPARIDVAGLRAMAARGERIPAVWHGLAGSPAGFAGGGSADAGSSLREQLAGLPAADRERMLLDLVCAHVAAVLGVPSAASVDARQAFKDLGFDSLTALELRNRLNAATGLRLPATLIFDYPTPAVLADYLGQEIAPDGIAADAGALEAVGRLEKIVQGMAADRGARSALAVRVKALLAILEKEHDAVDADHADNDLKAATAESIFDLLDNELTE
jgi:acyl carrier protein